MAVQICTVRYIGRFLGEDPLAVPWEVVEHLAGQLGIEDSSCVKRYPERRSTVYEHADEIQERFKYRDFTDRKWGREFATDNASYSDMAFGLYKMLGLSE